MSSPGSPPAVAEALDGAAAGEVGLRPAFAVALASFAVAVALRALYLAQDWRIDWATFPMFLGDEGVHGLMAMHILRGARPIFYYGAFYHGAFDAYITAVLFRVLGASVTVIRLTPGIFAIAGVAATYLVGTRMYGRRAGLLAAALVALPSKFFFEWGTLSLCGYCGYATLVMVILALTLGLLERVTAARLVLLGLVCGASVWSNQLSIGFVGVVWLALYWWGVLDRRQWLLLAAAAVIGVSPLIYGNIQTPFSTFRQLGRKALFAWTLARQGQKDAAESDDDDAREYRSQPLLEVLGAEPGRDGEFSAGGVLGALVLVVGAAGALILAWRSRRIDQAALRRHALVFALVAVAFGMGIGGFKGQPVGRYQLPLYPLVAVVAAGWLVRLAPRGAAAIVGLVVLLHTVDIVKPAQTDETTSASGVIATLDAKGLRQGIAANAMYELIFRSAERIVVVPLDHSRYEPYEKEVEGADELFYIYRDYHERKAAHRAMLRYLRERGVVYQKADVGDVHILYGFEPHEAVSFSTVGQVRAEFRREKFGE